MVGTFIKPTMIGEAVNGGFGFTLKQSEEIFAVMSFGTIPGTFLFGMLSTRIGKKKTLIGIALLIALTTYIPLFSPTNVMLWKAARFCTGVVLGGVFGCAMPLIADMFPAKYRGKLAATLTALFSLAMIFGGKVYGALGDANWKILMYTQLYLRLSEQFWRLYLCQMIQPIQKSFLKKEKRLEKKSVIWECTKENICGLD